MGTKGKHIIGDGSLTARRIKIEASRNPSKVCWWCGDRPHNHIWHADHLCPQLPDTPLVAACAYCNASRQGKVPQPSAIARLFNPTDIVCSLPKAALIHYLHTKSQRLLGSPGKFDVLIAAQKGRHIKNYGKTGRLENDKMRTRWAKEAKLI